MFQLQNIKMKTAKFLQENSPSLFLNLCNDAFSVT